MDEATEPVSSIYLTVPETTLSSTTALHPAPGEPHGTRFSVASFVSPADADQATASADSSILVTVPETLSSTTAVSGLQGTRATFVASPAEADQATLSAGSSIPLTVSETPTSAAETATTAATSRSTDPPNVSPFEGGVGVQQKFMMFLHHIKQRPAVS